MVKPLHFAMEEGVRRTLSALHQHQVPTHLTEGLQTSELCLADFSARRLVTALLNFTANWKTALHFAKLSELNARC